jgi:hypothetical protein
MRHSSFVRNEACQVNGLGWVVLWESLDLSTMTLSAFFWVESHRSMAWCRKFTMRLKEKKKIVNLKFLKTFFAAKFMLKLIDDV